jgi:hypothetical protein
MVILVWLGGVSALLAKRKTLSLDELCALAWNGTQTNRPELIVLGRFSTAIDRYYMMVRRFRIE